MTPAGYAGFGYSFSSPLYEPYRKVHNMKVIHVAGVTYEDYTYPVLFELGTSWLYQRRLSGLRDAPGPGQVFEDIFRERIFERCGMTSSSFYPTELIASRMMEMTPRHEGKVVRALSRPGDGHGYGPGQHWPRAHGGRRPVRHREGLPLVPATRARFRGPRQPRAAHLGQVVPRGIRI